MVATALIEQITVDVKLNNLMKIYRSTTKALCGRCYTYDTGYPTHVDDPYSTAITAYDPTAYGHCIQMGNEIQVKVQIPNNEIFIQ